MTVIDRRSALYRLPNSNRWTGSWITVLRTVLEEVRAQQWDLADDPDPVDDTMVSRLRAVVAEAWDAPQADLTELLTDYRIEIGWLTRTFGLETEVLLGALGRGWLPGGPDVDSEVADAQIALPRLRGIAASASVMVSSGASSTLLIAATDVRGDYGPVQLQSPRWTEAEVGDVWLCATAPSHEKWRIVRSLLERCLPHIGVRSSTVTIHDRDDVAVQSRSPTFGRCPIVAVAQIRDVDPHLDIELLIGRLEGWRQAIERLVEGEAAIVWSGYGVDDT